MKAATGRHVSRWLGQLAAAALITVLASSAGATQRYQPVRVEVLSDYRQPYAQYPLHTRAADGEYRAYLEAVQQESYSIRVSNLTADRIGVVVAVDGRNIISGKKSRLRPAERMYVLAPYQSATYSGWRTASDRVNRFYFTEADDSYAAAFDDRSAMGVIAVAAFREKFVHYRDHLEKDSDMAARRGQAAPQQKSGSLENASPGTGFGEERYSPSRQVQFEPERHAVASVFLKYEWRSMLCRKGIVPCHAPANRFWPRAYGDDSYGFAPAPPYRQRYRRLERG